MGRILPGCPFQVPQALHHKGTAHVPRGQDGQGIPQGKFVPLLDDPSALLGVVGQHHRPNGSLPDVGGAFRGLIGRSPQPQSKAGGIGPVGGPIQLLEQDQRGTYVLNSRDLRLIQYIPQLAEAGLSSLKIEGRAKSAYYAAIVTGAYRHCLDAAAAGEPLDPVWRDEVEHISHRHYATGFFYGQPGQYYESARYLRDWQICAVVTDCTPDGVATMSLRNKFAAGDTVELVGPDTKPFTITVPPMRGPDGEVLLEPKTPQMTFTMELPRPVPPMSFVRHAVALSGK